MPDIFEGLGEYPLRLLSEFEVGPDGVPATESYECSGGRFTLGLGATEWPNGKPIGPGEFCTPEQAIELTNWHIRKYLDVVDSTITRPMTVNQRGAMALMAYNIGPSAFAASSVAKRFNDGENLEHVAEAFGMWCKATNDVPDRSDIGKAYYDPIIGTNAKGQACWVGPATNPPKGWEMVREGDEFWAINPNPPPPHDPATGPPPEDQPPARIALGLRPRDYQKAMPGVLRRHLSEGMLFLNLDWRQACRKDTVSIVSQRIWDPNDKRWEDVVRTKTELSDILPLARPYPLPAPIESTSAVQPVPATEPAPEAKPSPAATPDSGTLVLTPEMKAAAPNASVANGSQPSPATQPATAGLPPVSKPQLNPTPAKVEVSASAAAPPEHPVPRVTDKPPLAAPVIAGQGDTKPIHRETKMPEGIPYGIDPTVGAKPMETTERFIGSAMLWLANGLRVGMANGMKVSGAGGFLVVLFLDMMKSPVTSALILSTIIAAICAVGWLCGVVLEKAGLRKKKKGERAASQLMY